MSEEEFAATIEAYTYPDEFKEYIGEVEIAVGATIGQQGRKPFGLVYRTLIGNDEDLLDSKGNMLLDSTGNPIRSNVF